MRDTVKRDQLRLFDELVETETTRDHVSDAGTFIRPPPGRGWIVADNHRERHTKWMRRRPTARPWKRKRSC
jgi:hypothetical protein